MKVKTVISSSFFLRIAFVAALGIVIFISATSYKHSSALSESSDLVVQSYKTKEKLNQLISEIKDAETGQRGFIITHDLTFLRPYYAAHQKVNSSFRELRTLLKDDPQQLTNLDTLGKLTNRRFKILWHTLEQDISNARGEMHLSMISGKVVMDQIRIQTQKMIDLETADLLETQKTYESETFLTPLFTAVLLAFSILVFSFSFFKINQDLGILRRSNETLVISNELINHAEEIGSFSCWQWDVGAKKLLYSGNQFRLLGCEPDSFEPTIENFLEFVHIRDRRKVLDNTTFVSKGDRSSEIFFRVVRKDGKLRYFRSVSKMITTRSGRKTLIGINSDVTEQFLSSIALEERNRELENNNKELASFNHIASHDLQEPLRKIQTFISRISESETQLPSTSWEYFQRIRSSADKMRKLIDDLLLFSRINKVEKTFEKVDLNSIVENVRIELSGALDEKQAQLTCAPLPIIPVIPFQVHQLLVNLIENSIKYSKSPLILKIDCEIVSAADEEVLNKENHRKKFHKISIEDNGVGFDTQYSQAIFDPFYRLHNNSEYPGTGIGLAICKKIMENHNGYIDATGKPNDGATFNFYFPVR